MGHRFVRSLGDDCIEVEFPSTSDAQEFATGVRERGDFLDVVVGVASVAVRYDATIVSRQQAEERVENCLRADHKKSQAREVELTIPVSYGGTHGPDLDAVCDQLRLSRDEFIVKHMAKKHPVEMLGFTPGFAYLETMGSNYEVARLETPRPRVVAGSIGFVGGRTGLYALPGPGGWPLIAHTDMPLFVRDDENPFIISAGMSIRFSHA